MLSIVAGDNSFANEPLKGFGYPPYSDSNIPSATTGIDYMVSQTRKANADVLMTVPMIGWVAKDTTTTADSSGANPSKGSVQTTGQFMTDWVTHLVSTFGNANSGGVKYYQLDNEPDNWKSMHTDVHPTDATSAELGPICRPMPRRSRPGTPPRTFLRIRPRS